MAAAIPSEITSRWEAMWRELAAQPDGSLLEDLAGRYAQPQRRYHTLRHLAECFACLDEMRGFAEHPAEIELALWFHDAIYEPGARDNEQKSAEWAHAAALAAGLPAAAVARVRHLVMATRHLEGPGQGDVAVMRDADLWILAAPPARFDEYDDQIRAEFAHVPAPRYRRLRARLLEDFLRRPQIYSTPLYVERHEAAARRNIAHALRRRRATPGAAM